jgi:hypothetical protein
MNHDQLARGYDPKSRIEEGYSYNTVPPQEQPYPKAILGASVEQRQQGGVTREVQHLEKNLHILAASLDTLENRLASACVPAPENLASGLRSTDGGGCSLANQVAGLNSMLSFQINRIEMMYQGIDL